MPAAFAALVRDVAPRTLAVSGGGTARRCYEALAAVGGIDWGGITALVGDERWVPVEHADSNEGMARRVLLDAVGPGTVHSVRGSGRTPAEAAAAYDGLLRGLGAIDVVHLGLGPDGHTASLFPGSAALDERERLVVATGDGAHDHERVTLTFPGIALARLAVVTVEGAAKREAFARVSRGDDVPASRIRAGSVLWLVDPAAATRG